MSFYLSKILWLILNPFNIFIFVTLLSIFLYFVKLRRLSFIIFLINFVFIVLISFLPIGSYLIYNIEKEYHSYIKPPDQVDGILILGGATNPLLYNEYDQISLNGSSERLVESENQVTVYCHSKLFNEKPAKVNGVNLIYTPSINSKIFSQLFNSFFSFVHVCFSNVDVILVVNSANGPFGILTKLFNKKNLTIFAFTSPWVIGFLSFGIYPIIISFYYSLCQYDVLREPMFIGLENYRIILYEDAYFWKTIWNTLYYTIFRVPINIFLSLLIVFASIFVLSKIEREITLSFSLS